MTIDTKGSSFGFGLKFLPAASERYFAVRDHPRFRGIQSTLREKGGAEQGHVLYHLSVTEGGRFPMKRGEIDIP